MFSAFINIFKIEELRKRIFLTLALVVLCRIAAYIPCPGIDPSALTNYINDMTKNSDASQQVLGMFNLFSGGALQNFALATLGIMPYITASIIMQLMIPVIPLLGKLSREGDAGRQKITQYTRYLTLTICLVQAAMAAMAMIDPTRLGMPAATQRLVVFDNNALFVFMTMTVLTAGTMMVMWLGEQITERGIGNGASLIITVNIIERAPYALNSLIDMTKSQSVGGDKFGVAHILILFIVFAAVTSATILLTQGQRRIPLQIAQRAVGATRIPAGGDYLPLRVNFSGVMPIIFANAILIFPSVILGAIPPLQKYAVYFVYGSSGYLMLFALMILAFSFFWVANQFNPITISENLKKQGAYVPGIRPGKPTAEFLDYTMTRVTVAGALFLTALSIFPLMLTSSFNINFDIASFFGGTSLLIIVGVTLDTLKQMESHLVMKNYDGFLKTGRIRGRVG